jgi:hypothetical protein
MTTLGSECPKGERDLSEVLTPLQQAVQCAWEDCQEAEWDGRLADAERHYTRYRGLLERLLAGEEYLTNF